nr:hypothetical protein [Tanacetum cinerariifolium]
SLGNVTFDELYRNAEESPFDTKSEIKAVKRINLQQTDDEDHIKFMWLVNSDIEDDTGFKHQEVQDHRIEITLIDSSKYVEAQEDDSDLESVSNP